MYRKYFKRPIDIILSAFALIVLSPLLLIVAILIKIDSKGPVLFRQERIGLDGRTFNIVKFRTMVVGAEQLGTGLTIQDMNDRRITKVGGWLRRLSLDELPQFVNVLTGDMAIVGPRPPAVYSPYNGFDNYPEWIRKRFSVRPGITGLSQVKYRNSADWETRFKLDLIYVEKLSFWVDLKLILQTAITMFKQENLY